MIWLAVVFALASAATTAVSTSTQHLAASRAPLVAVLLAVTLGPVGFVLHVLALDNGPIGLVQPIAILGIVLAVPLRAALGRTRPGRAELVAVAVTGLAIAALLLATDAREAPLAPDRGALVASVGALALVAVLLVAVAGGVPHPTGRAFLLGSASGILFGLMSVLIEADQLRWALVACGVSGVAVNQLAYRAARLSASMPVLNVVNVLLTLGFAHLLLGEVPHHDAVSVSASVAALAAMAWGLWRLASADVAVADDDVLGGRHLGQAHGAAGVQLLGADPDLGAEPELSAVGEPRGGVHEHGR
ncbi:drug/metabolite transporter (DMT)-like permease [Nocardioides aromaticivorans]|uniref:Drug/metabolite transporter (DMT)-like permease n=1 Tax=Nocardioides aromaticivorans TaxID=200618 RepID=A0A7Z0CJQ0_9ACTN|nr:drug/metabolite transporter (DMT)-like permease [Nocardioides aromaticivorans]